MIISNFLAITGSNGDVGREAPESRRSLLELRNLAALTLVNGVTVPLRIFLSLSLSSDLEVSYLVAVVNTVPLGLVGICNLLSSVFFLVVQYLGLQ